MNRDHKRESPDLRHEIVEKNDKLELPESEEKAFQSLEKSAGRAT